MRTLSELNLNEGGRPVTRTPPSDRDFAAFEAEYRITIPPPLKTLLRFSNGGHPELNSFATSGSSFAINELYHLTVSEKGPGSLWYSTKNWGPVLGPNTLAFADDAGGNQFFLDLNDTPASVWICMHDQDMRRIKLASSLEAFVDDLSTDDDMI